MSAPSPTHLLIQIRFDNLQPANSPSNTALIPLPTPPYIASLQASLIFIIEQRAFGIAKPFGLMEKPQIKTKWSVCWDLPSPGCTYELRMALEKNEDVAKALQMMAVRRWRDSFIVDVQIR
ncbi:hypothetical protein ONS95_007204 [Cadophora gregata]|uniref:uncharacterized protein n=1 Tax=Cadophora gregata TaxID=51156 RepID=UPI0026DBC30E|nr:uncharacterized protein ONS95_007204 [Cadophora gregata]KAK0100754.1 hypothetical protein ONS95_007204 [Cadophora gregata]KAK0117251.1 hypothetical protein ONS96_013084 [Cadophora gregata f. sp. sojae]